jgi:hypothetical protein
VTEAESQVVLHILTEHEIQMYLKKMADALWKVYREGNFMGDGFWPDGSTSSRNYG